MKLRFEVNQADDFRRGIDRPKSIVSIEVNPADVPEEARKLIADHLVGIDVLQSFYHNGDVIKGHHIRELTYTSRDPKRIVAKAANAEALVEAIKANDRLIENIQKSFDRPIQFRLIDKPPKNEAEFTFIPGTPANEDKAFLEAVRQKRRIWFDCFIHDVQTSLNKALLANSYIVYLLPTPPSTAAAIFYCEPVFAADFGGRQVVAHSPIIVLNEKTGRIVEAANLFKALDVYMLYGLRPGNLLDDLSILSWEGKWVIVNPEGLVDLANHAQSKESRKGDEAD